MQHCMQGFDVYTRHNSSDCENIVYVYNVCCKMCFHLYYASNTSIVKCIYMYNTMNDMRLLTFFLHTYEFRIKKNIS